ncbi:MAG: DUF4974 domain-containing protein [Reichenbachiella sp.]
MDEKFYIADLIAQKIKGSISTDDQVKLDDWCSESEENQLLLDKAIRLDAQLDKLEVYALFDQGHVWVELENRLFPSKQVGFDPSVYLKYAASILLPLLLMGSIFYYFVLRTEYQDLAMVDQLIHPKVENVTLVLSNGEEVILNQSTQRTTITQGVTTIKNEDKAIVYEISDTTKKEYLAEVLAFNELNIPRGGSYKLTLADGTKVWLNSASSLRFPVAFADNKREVYLTGEAYFEVTHNGSPFVVNAQNMDVNVLGTSFNVTAYPDEDLSTTLVEGKVKIDIKENGALIASELLAPDDQSVWSDGSSELAVVAVNTSNYTSWKEGKLEFNNDDLERVMGRLARWYDFEYRFENETAKEYHFTAQFDNHESISSVLSMLEKTTDIEFKLQDKTIIIL